MEYQIHIADKSDMPIIGHIHKQAFETDVESRLVASLINKGEAVYSNVVLHKGKTIGHIMYSRLDTAERALALAPIAVLPEYQNQGAGTVLIDATLKTAAQEGWQIVFVLGAPDYYQRFGFSLSLAAGYTCPYSGDYFMAKALADYQPKGKGEITYPSSFNDL